ncbi:RNA polymerase III-inhibiting protein maf1, partial [Kappamyces sp. JEL0680]
VPALSLAMNAVNNYLLVHFGNSKAAIEDAIWSAVDQVINTKVCDVYTFLPSREMEPDSEEGNLWSFYYFFYNKPEKRIVFFTARAVSLLAPLQPEEDQEDYAFEEEDSASQIPRHASLSYEQYTMESLEI